MNVLYMSLARRWLGHGTVQHSLRHCIVFTSANDHIASLACSLRLMMLVTVTFAQVYVSTYKRGSTPSPRIQTLSTCDLHSAQLVQRGQKTRIPCLTPAMFPSYTSTSRILPFFRHVHRSSCARIARADDSGCPRCPKARRVAR